MWGRRKENVPEKTAPQTSVSLSFMRKLQGKKVDFRNPFRNLNISEEKACVIVPHNLQMGRNPRYMKLCSSSI